MPRTIVAFDLYGTLLSTGSIAQELSKLYGDEKAKKIAAQARRYQLEYTWRLNSMGELPAVCFTGQHSGHDADFNLSTLNNIKACIVPSATSRDGHSGTL